MFCEAVDNRKKSVLSSVTSVRLLTESGTRDYCSNWPLLVALNLFFVGLRVIYLDVDKELS